MAVTLRDQFIAEEPVTVRTPRYLCTPAHKDITGQ